MYAATYGIHRNGFGLAPRNRSGLNEAASGKFSSDSCASWKLTITLVPAGRTQSPKRIRSFVQRIEPSIFGRVRCTSKIVACRNSDPPASTSSASRDISSGCRRNRSTVQANCEAVVS